MTVLVLYIFHQYNDRVKNFIEKAVYRDDSIHFVFIANDPNISIQLPEYVELIKRKNIGYDFGGWSEALDIKKKKLQNYQYIIFANSSIIGPFCDTKKWPHLLIDGLKQDIKLFGVTINTMMDPDHFSHVQSYLFVVEVDTAVFLIKRGIFSINDYAKTHQEAIYQKEIKMSRIIINKGWNIASLFKYYDGIDFRKPFYKQTDRRALNDVMYKKSEIEGLWTREELCFIKGNRDMV